MRDIPSLKRKKEEYTFALPEQIAENSFPSPSLYGDANSNGKLYE